MPLLYLSILCHCKIKICQNLLVKITLYITQWILYYHQLLKIINLQTIKHYSYFPNPIPDGLQNWAFQIRGSTFASTTKIQLIWFVLKTPGSCKWIYSNQEHPSAVVGSLHNISFTIRVLDIIRFREAIYIPFVIWGILSLYFILFLEATGYRRVELYCRE